MTKHNIVFLPGTLCDSRIFDQQISILDDNKVHCSTINLAECSSLAEAASTTLSQIESNSCFSIVAFSMGGMVAFELLRLCPERIESVVLIASNAHADLPGRAEGRAQYLQQAQKDGLATLIAEIYMPNYLIGNNETHRELIVQMAEDMGVIAFENQLKILADRPDSSDLLTEITCPVLLIGAKGDPLCPPSEQQRMHELIANSELHTYADSGHFISLEQSEKLSEDLITWFGKRQHG